MANRRQLKKKINYAFTMTVGLCGWEAAHVSEDKSEAIYEVVTKLVSLRQDLINRISHTEPGNVKGFYKKLKEDMEVESQKILHELAVICGKQE
ncbi:hypothetical protein [Phocaeicola coprophilus]|jgi:hypothetical protein|uniref:hypothetical protein n=1 Tax=Phocaeicola coprophilus TaxID=387090 RepID=UPI00266C805E|nr:hypothetical protein [Phocaeicola coprophilus]